MWLKNHKKRLFAMVFAFMLLVNVNAYANSENLILNETVKTNVSQRNISVIINDAKFSFADEKPIIIDGRTLVPLRGVFSRMGYSVNWDAKVWGASDEYMQLVGADYDPTLITIQTDTNYLKNPILITRKNVVKVNGAVLETDSPPLMVGSTYYLPLRALAEATGATVGWENSTSTVTITYTAVPIP